VGLRKANFQFVLDDYGSGYSNLTRVRHYPFVNIKLDMEVVWDYHRERDSLLPNIVKAFTQMGFSITAEGIETAEMADSLTEIGCDYLQGFFFDKPLPVDEFVAKYAGAGKSHD
jgi:EAL domain-containing protein (putative c-di-GMP-specific phosphodiesterase class I)